MVQNPFNGIERPVLHGIGWLGDVKRIALKIDKIKVLGFKPKMRSREAVAKTVTELLDEVSGNH